MSPDSPKKQPNEQVIRKAEKAKAAFLKTEQRDKGYTRAAQLLIILGKEHAAKVLAHLTEEEALAVSREIANIQAVSSEDATKVLRDFGYMMKVRDLVARGGLDKAHEMIIAAFGEDKGGEFYARLLEKTVPHPFAFINDLKADAVLALLRDESAPVISLVLSHIDPLLSAKVLTALPVGLKKQIVKRIASLDRVPPEVIRQTEEALRNRIKETGEIITQELDGTDTLAQILRNLDIKQGRNLIDELAKSDPELASVLEARLFSLDIIERISDRDLQKILRAVSDNDLARLLKGKDEGFTQKLLANVSVRRAELIRFEHAGIGTMLKSELEKTENDFLGLVRDMYEKEEIAIRGEDDEYVE